MLSQNRTYHFMGEMTLRTSRVLAEGCDPKDDTVNWLFLQLPERQLSFIYTIEQPLEASYDHPFRARLSFLMIEAATELVQLHHPYPVLRGQEKIGTITITNALV